MMGTCTQKYEKYGHVAVTHASTIECSFAKEFADSIHVDVIISSARSCGELRVPEGSRILWSRSDTITTKTFHKESGVVYIFDPLQIMLSSGNVNERSRFGATITATDEIVLDMFAGIGYFSLPLATNRTRRVRSEKKVLDRPKKLVAIEKNEVSYGFLLENFQRYAKTACAHELILGDNRHVAHEYIGKCHRILMGFLPDTDKFIPRALDFASKTPVRDGMPRAIIHYHFLFHKNEDGRTKAGKDFAEHIEATRISIMDLRVIKSYAHNLYHAVADVYIV